MGAGILERHGDDHESQLDAVGGETRVSDWTPTERKIKTPYGYIRYGGPCRDDYRSLVVYDQGGGNTVLSLQRPAMTAFKAAEVRYARRSAWTSARIKKNGGRPIKVLPGTNRSCATQAALYAMNTPTNRRYASPAITGHTRGLAIDVDQSQPNLDKIHAALCAEGWTQTRPVDEKWHYSYGVTI